MNDRASISPSPRTIRPTMNPLVSSSRWDGVDELILTLSSRIGMISRAACFARWTAAPNEQQPGIRGPDIGWRLIQCVCNGASFAYSTYNIIQKNLYEIMLRRLQYVVAALMGMLSLSEARLLRSRETVSDYDPHDGCIASFSTPDDLNSGALMMMVDLTTIGRL